MTSGSSPPSGIYVRFVLKKGDEVIFDLTEEVNAASHFALGAHDLLDLFRKMHPDVSLLDEGIRIEFQRAP